MKRIYILLALLPISLESKIYGSEINKAIEPELKSARQFLRQNYLKLELDTILSNLISCAQESDNAKNIVVINKLHSIKAALENFKKKQYANFWSTWFGSTPKIVSEQINPALDKVQNALSTVEKKSYTNLIIAGSILGSLAVASGVAGAAYLYSNQRDNELFDIADQANINFISGQRNNDASKNNPFN